MSDKDRVRAKAREILQHANFEGMLAREAMAALALVSGELLRAFIRSGSWHPSQLDDICVHHAHNIRAVAMNNHLHIMEPPRAIKR